MVAALQPKFEVYLADDDADDRLLFEEALMEISGNVKLTVTRNGEQLMNVLDATPAPLPDIIFIDLNMPLKNGFECLEEIKNDEKYKGVRVIIFSTSCQKEAIDHVYSKGADYYICKPDNFQKLKRVLSHVISVNTGKTISRPSREDFILTA